MAQRRAHGYTIMNEIQSILRGYHHHPAHYKLILAFVRQDGEFGTLPEEVRAIYTGERAHARRRIYRIDKANIRR